MCIQVNDGFIAHFYDISEHVSPPITWGFLGTNEELRELCYYFKVRTAFDCFELKEER